jgi:type IV fimbrial biogenesis protein FimT
MKRQHGFTLIEAMVVVLIIIVLAGTGIPAMQDFVTSTRLKGVTSDLFSDIVRTRSEAIKRNMLVSMVPTEASWAKGWSIPHPDPSKQALQLHAALPGVTVVGPSSLTFTPAGRLLNDTNPQFRLTAPNGMVRCITVDLGGRPNIQNKSC